MREIKFRAFNQKREEMMENIAVINDNIIIWAFDSDNCGEVEWDYIDDNIPVMQFTGLYDNTTFIKLTEEEQKEWLQQHTQDEWKGKPIYEGDVLKNHKYYYRVIYSDGGFILQHIHLKDFNGKDLIWGEINKIHDKDFDFEIVGNIYEHPHLLRANYCE